jgi:prepilin-type N-terminal cleavage/methylation domain-containing protein
MSARTRGITLVEVAIVVTIIAVLVLITYTVLARAKFARDDVACKSKALNTLNMALNAYRADYGDLNGVYGRPERLGLPPHPLALAAHRGQHFLQLLPEIHCPRAYMPDLIGGLAPAPPWYLIMSEISMAGWDDANAALRGQTPIAYCVFHNPPDHDLEDPTLQHRVNLLLLDGTIRHELITGMDVLAFRLDTYSKLKSRP